MKHKAFSLLELLLVLAIVAVIALTGLGLIRQKMLDEKINLTYSQIQTLFNAATSYYNDHNHQWPTTTTQLNQYLGVNVTDQCPWQTSGCYSFDPEYFSTSY